MSTYVDMRKRQRLTQIAMQVPPGMSVEGLIKELAKPGVLFWNPPETELRRLAQKIFDIRMAERRQP